jgi:hypothetical protein
MKEERAKQIAALLNDTARWHSHARGIVLRHNPKIDASVVAAHERLERDLKKLGVEIQPRYNIEPPFGRRPTSIHNHSRALTRNS